MLAQHSPGLCQGRPHHRWSRPIDTLSSTAPSRLLTCSCGTALQGIAMLTASTLVPDSDDDCDNANPLQVCSLPIIARACVCVCVCVCVCGCVCVV